PADEQGGAPGVARVREQGSRGHAHGPRDGGGPAVLVGDRERHRILPGGRVDVAAARCAGAESFRHGPGRRDAVAPIDDGRGRVERAGVGEQGGEGERLAGHRETGAGDRLDGRRYVLDRDGGGAAAAATVLVRHRGGDRVRGVAGPVVEVLVPDAAERQ